MVCWIAIKTTQNEAHSNVDMNVFLCSISAGLYSCCGWRIYADQHCFSWNLKLNLHEIWNLLHMMKTLILSFFTFLSIYIEGLEIFPYPQIFFLNIKMQPRYNRKCYSLIFLPDKFDHRVHVTQLWRYSTLGGLFVLIYAIIVGTRTQHSEICFLSKTPV
jgi:hypothetical protein